MEDLSTAGVITEGMWLNAKACSKELVDNLGDSFIEEVPFMWIGNEDWRIYWHDEDLVSAEYYAHGEKGLLVANLLMDVQGEYKSWRTQPQPNVY